MFHSPTVAQAIHADRVRDLERAARERRLLFLSGEPVPASLSRSFVRSVPGVRDNPRGDAANAPV
jgi:hypothetical protein